MHLFDSFAQTHNLPLTPLSAPIALETFDGRPVVSGNMTHKTTLDISIGMHCERIPLLVTRLSHYPIVLGIPWLRRHDPSIKFSANSLVFDSSFSTEHCLSNTALRYAAVQTLLKVLLCLKSHLLHYYQTLHHLVFYRLFFHRLLLFQAVHQNPIYT